MSKRDGYNALVQMWVQSGATYDEAVAAARKVYPELGTTRTDHSAHIARLRSVEHSYACLGPTITDDERTIGLAHAVAADLLELHDATGISLDSWLFARNLVEHLVGAPIVENGV